MELFFIAFMLVGGGALAIFVMIASAIARKEKEGSAQSTPQRETVVASLLYHVVEAGGLSPEEALRAVRRGSGIAAPVTRGIDVANWAESFASHHNEQQRRDLLETAVRLVASRSPIPLRQYAALLDLSFGLGFHTDALAKLRTLYGFDYIDPASASRPREAEHRGKDAPHFARAGRSRHELLGILGLKGEPNRQELAAAYRKLAAQHHPDRVHGASERARTEAAARFIEITRAYEELSRE